MRNAIDSRTDASKGATSNAIAATPLPALPSIVELSRHALAIARAFNRIEMTAGDDVHAQAQERIASGLTADRTFAIAELILNMPAVTLADIAPQLSAALLAIDAAADDDWPDDARRLRMQLRRVVLSVAPVAARAACLGSDDFHYQEMDKLHDGEFPPSILGRSVRRGPFGTDSGDPDAELIQLCNRLIAVCQARNVSCERIKTDEERDLVLAPLDAEWSEIGERIQTIGRPVTKEGALAMARAARLNLDHRLDGKPHVADLGEWMAVSVCAWLTGDEAPASEWGDAAP